MKAIRVYADTSVFGGVYDDEFKQPSLTFFEQVKSGQFVLVTSAVVQDEMVAAPLTVRRFFEEMLGLAEVADITENALDLRDAYLQAKIVSPKYSDDALHVALATVAGCTLIVSWNFQHIVHFQKIPLYNALNTLQGYQQIAIFSPREVIQYEDEEV
jgi:predicted nucleic acid-binding protein